MLSDEDVVWCAVHQARKRALKALRCGQDVRALGFSPLRRSRDFVLRCAAACCAALEFADGGEDLPT